MQNSEGLWVRFRVNIEPRRGGFHPSRASLGSRIPKPEIQITAVSQGNNVPGIRGIREGRSDERGFLEAFVMTIKLTPPPPPNLSATVRQAIADSLKGTVLVEITSVVFDVQRKMREAASPSRPGGSPGIDTGDLERSIKWVMDDDGLGGRMGTDLDYARHLEFGTLNMPARPFLLSTFEEAKVKFERVIRHLAQSTFNRLLKKPFFMSDALGFPVPTGNPKLDSVIIWYLYYDGKKYDEPPPSRSTAEIQKIVDNLNAELKHSIENSNPELREIKKKENEKEIKKIFDNPLFKLLQDLNTVDVLEVLRFLFKIIKRKLKL